MAELLDHDGRSSATRCESRGPRSAPPVAVRKLGKLRLDRREEPGMHGHPHDRLRVLRN
jgi:hypothetical protein